MKTNFFNFIILKKYRFPPKKFKTSSTGLRFAKILSGNNSS